MSPASIRRRFCLGVALAGRKKSALVVAVFGLLLLSGCGDRGQAETELDFWAMGAEAESARALAREFEAINPGITVRVQQIPWSAAHEKLLTAYAGGNLPDVFQLGNTWIPEFVALGALLSLDARLEASEVISPGAYPDGVFDTNVVDGQTWGIPWYIDTRLLFYRTDLLARAGHERMPADWVGWMKVMSTMRAQGASDFYPVLLPMNDWSVPVILARQVQPNVLRDDDHRGNFSDPQLQPAWDFYVGLFEHGLAPTTGASQVLNLYQAFGAGQFGMFISGPWNIEELRERLPGQQSLWSTAPLPSPDGDQIGTSLAGGASLVISSRSRSQDEAWRLLAFLSTPASQAALHRSTGTLPANLQAWRDEQLHDAPKTRAFWQQLQHARAAPKIPEWERIADKTARYLESAIRRELPLEVALNRLDDEVDRILEKRRWLRDRAQGKGSD
jgi:multiple sugar transport system substrate-binding protein